jgi:hypothetical protein
MVDMIRSVQQQPKQIEEPVVRGGDSPTKTFTGIDIVGEGLPNVDIGIETESDVLEVSVEIDINDLEPNAIISKVHSRKSVFLEMIKYAIKVPTLGERFDPEKYFKVDTKRKTDVKISCMTSEFQHEFLDQEIAPRPGYYVSVSKLAKTSMTLEVIDEIGPEYEIDLAGMYQILHRSAMRGDVPFPGVLQPNVFFMKNRFGKPRSVHSAWLNGGWIISSRAIDPGCGWSYGNVFHLNPLFKRPV